MRSVARDPGMRRRVFAVCALVLVGALAGCTPEDVRPTPTTSPSATPLFASDEEALAAATKAYAAYLKMSDTIAHDGGADPERIKPYVTEEWAKKEIEVFDRFESKGLRQTGETHFDGVRLQHRASSSMSVYVCGDFSDVAIVNGGGAVVTPEDRPSRSSLVVSFVLDPGNLVLADNEPWSGKSFC